MTKAPDSNLEPSAWLFLNVTRLELFPSEFLVMPSKLETLDLQASVPIYLRTLCRYSAMLEL